jgi:tricorn protease
LAYTRNTHGLIQTVHLYSLAQNRSHQITDGLTEVSEPVFDPDGKTLYVIASSEAGPVKDWFAQSSLDMTFKHSIYAIVLAKNEPSPLPPEYEVSPADKPADSSSEPQDQAAKAESKGKGKDKASKDQQAGPAPITIDFDGLNERIVALPTGGATLRNLQVGKSGELYYLSTPATPALEALAAPAELKRLVLKERTPQTLLTGIDAYQVSHDGEKLLFHQGQDWKTVATAGQVKAEAAAPLAVGEVSILIDPRQEWRQIVREAWRLNRDGFYAPNFHGADWNAVWRRYEPFIDHAATRWDVGRIISAVASELKVGHSFSTQGESIAKPAKVNVGLLGADFTVNNGHYQFSKV